jgi:hypothetical protein
MPLASGAEVLLLRTEAAEGGRRHDRGFCGCDLAAGRRDVLVGEQPDVYDHINPHHILPSIRKGAVEPRHGVLGYTAIIRLCSV